MTLLLLMLRRSYGCISDCVADIPPTVPSMLPIEVSVNSIDDFRSSIRRLEIFVQQRVLIDMRIDPAGGGTALWS